MADGHLFVHGFAHIVNGERGNGNGGERFHLDAGSRGDFGGSSDDDAIAFGWNGEFHYAMSDGQRVAERNEIAGFFGGHDASEAGGGEDVTLGDFVAFDEVERGGLEMNLATGDGLTELNGFAGNIDHGGFAGGGEMGEAVFHKY